MLTPTLKPWLVGVAQTSPAGPHALLFSTTLTLKGFTRFTINESWEQPRCRCLSQQTLKETRPQKKRGERWGIGDFHGFIKETRAGTAIVTCWAFSFAKGWRHIWAYNMEAFASQIMLALVKFQSKNTPKHSPPHPPVCPDLGNTSPHSHTDLGHLGNLFFSMHGRYHAVYKPDWITHPQRNWRWNTCLDTANPFWYTSDDSQKPPKTLILAILMQVTALVVLDGDGILLATLQERQLEGQPSHTCHIATQNPTTRRYFHRLTNVWQ